MDRAAALLASTWAFVGNPQFPVIAVTAFAMKGDEEKIREGGCEAYISKPISVLSFLQVVDGFLKRPQ